MEHDRSSVKVQFEVESEDQSGSLTPRPAVSWSRAGPWEEVPVRPALGKTSGDRPSEAAREQVVEIVPAELLPETIERRVFVDEEELDP